MLPVRLPGTIQLSGRLVPSPVKKRPDQLRPSDDAANFARNWTPRSEMNHSSQHNLKRIGSRTPSAVRFKMRRTSLTSTLSPLAHILPPRPVFLPAWSNIRHSIRQYRTAHRSLSPQLHKKLCRTPEPPP